MEKQDEQKIPQNRIAAEQAGIVIKRLTSENQIALAAVVERLLKERDQAIAALQAQGAEAGVAKYYTASSGPITTIHEYDTGRVLEPQEVVKRLNAAPPAQAASHDALREVISESLGSLPAPLAEDDGDTQTDFIMNSIAPLLGSAQAARVPDGCVAMPVKLPKEMEQAAIDAAREYMERTGGNCMKTIYRALVEYAQSSAAPAPAEKQTRSQLPEGITNVRNAATGESVRVDKYTACTHPDCGRFYDPLVNGMSCRSLRDGACAADEAPATPQEGTTNE